MSKSSVAYINFLSGIMTSRGTSPNQGSLDPSAATKQLV